MRKKPEILAPAGDMEKLQMAVLYGADAVYLAGTSFGMRSFAGNFTPDELPKAVAFAHSRGVRVHAAVNTMPRNDEAAQLPAYLERLNDAHVDALILADLGAFTLAERYAPKCERHISTQQSIANYECARAWYDLGAKRVVLAREMSLQEIRELREKVPAELEIETFCHGAMCVSYSGRCLLSNYMTGRDSNRGQCAQPCRYQYALMEEKRPGEYFPVFEDEKGTYIMNSRASKIVCTALLRTLRIEPIREPRGKLVEIPLQDIVQLHAERSRRLGQIPRNVAKLFGKVRLVKRMPLHEPLFHNIDRLAAFAAKTHHAVEQDLPLRQRRIERRHGFFLVFVRRHAGFLLYSPALSAAAWRTKLIGGTGRGSFILKTVCGVRGS